MDLKVAKRAADNIRILSAAMVEKAESGHPGGAMGGADFIHILYSEFLRFDPDNFAWDFRDRFFLDPGHMSPMLYSILLLSGAFTMDEIKQFRQWASPTPGHPEHDPRRGVENTSGPLGMGHGMALGAAIAERFLAARFGEWTAHNIYTYISDGGIQEEISQGVGRIAGHLGLSNYVMFYDSNDIQLSHVTEEVTSEDTAKKYEAWGWRVETIDGNDPQQIRAALTRATEESQKPYLIIGKTVMGKGCLTANEENFEKMTCTHGMPISKAGASFAHTVKNLGGNPDNPFEIFPEVKEYYKKILDRKRTEVAARKEEQQRWESSNQILAKKLHQFLNGAIPEIDFASIKQASNIATRKASGTVLALFAKKVENMIVSSADLSNSDNTGAFLDNSSSFVRGDFSGGFLQAGVAEMTMGAIVNGMALHGGVIPVAGTFFVFSDYMKPAVRLAALMKLPVKYVWTHDAFRVGEDGPTHQPIEQEAQIRLLEKMKNLDGERSMLVLRPADAAETTVAWKIALENTACPTALLLSRQNISDIPAKASGSRYEDALQAQKGAYTVLEADGKPDIILVANGSEVHTMYEAAVRLRDEKKLNVQVVSAISEALFLEQPQEYRETIFPFGVPVLGLTAGLPVSMRELVGPFGKVIGMERFGASAPFNVLDEKFGYTAEHIIGHVDTYLKEFDALIARVAGLKKG
ncbi:MAG: transketolase family protein [Fibrobacterota bacterium]